MSRALHASSALPYLSKIEAPVLGLYPSAGPITSAEQMSMLKQNIRNLQVIRVPSTFHKIQLMFPRTCATHLLHFAARMMVRCVTKHSEPARSYAALYDNVVPAPD